MADEWQTAPLWRWVDSAAWIARRDPALMALLCGYRDYRDRVHEWRHAEDPPTKSATAGAGIEAASRDILDAHIGSEARCAAERALWRRLIDGRLSAQRLGDGSAVAAGQWVTLETCPWDFPAWPAGRMPHVLLTASAVMALWPADRQPAKGGRPTKFEWEEFLQEAVAKLGWQGGYTASGFQQADLERHMSHWCMYLSGWEKQPSEASVRRYVKVAEKRFGT